LKYASNLSREEVDENGDTFFIDEAFVKMNGKQHYLRNLRVSAFSEWSTAVA